MNNFELIVFLVHCVVGFVAGVILARYAGLGVVGWIIGAPAGFCLSFAGFYALAKWNDARTIQDLNQYINREDAASSHHEQQPRKE